MRQRFFSLFILVIFFTPLCAQATQVRVAVASNFLMPVQALASFFEQQTGHKVTISSGSTGKLYAQIVNGAPFDIFLAANSREPERLESTGRTIVESRFTYALGRLALWGPQIQGNNKDLKDILNDTTIQRLTIANPATAPYGAAAVEVLKKLGLYNELKQKIIRGENVSQTYQYVASGAAQLGFVALSQLKASQQTTSDNDQDHFWVVDPTLYSPIQQQAVLLKRGGENTAARQFLDFLKSPEVHNAIATYGYGGE